jgi:hypothetical protein
MTGKNEVRRNDGLKKRVEDGHISRRIRRDGRYLIVRTRDYLKQIVENERLKEKLI